MRWTKVFFGTMGLFVLAGCASQDTLIPTTETKMIDIYRDATNDVSGQSVDTVQPESICAQLELDESALSCEEKVGALVTEEYRRLDEAPPPLAMDYIPYTRTVENELDNLFPRLANPDLAIYVYPHLATRTRAPIPGYTTVIPLYERVEYRLPGESLRVTPTSAEATQEIRAAQQPMLTPGLVPPPADEVRYAKPGNLP